MTSLYRWPAEWERQAATWIAWPHNRKTWPGYFDNIPQSFANFITELSRAQPVHVLAGPPHIVPAARDFLKDLCDQKHANVFVHAVETNDVWIRDYGPTFVTRRSDQALIGIDWQFNAWGGKYPPFDKDASAAESICRLAQAERVTSQLFCEGGGLETDGAGTVLTTSSVLLSSTRNPDWSRSQVEAELERTLGARQVVWVDGGGIEGDDTDGHIDQLARFVNQNTIVCAASSSSQDPNSAGLEANYRILKNARNADGEPYQVLRLPTPLPRLVDGKRVPESYCNYLIANGIVIVPTFRSPETDTNAIALLGSLMPDRKIVPLDAWDLIWGLGAFHCASQQQPEVL